MLLVALFKIVKTGERKKQQQQQMFFNRQKNKLVRPYHDMLLTKKNCNAFGESPVIYADWK